MPVRQTPITAVVIAYNDEPNMRACLESITWADEIIVVDSHSTDATERISREFTEQVYQHDFHGFGRLRNEALAHATHDWVFSLDTDERATPELRDEIRQVLAAGPQADAYLCLARIIFSAAGSSIAAGFPTIGSRNSFARAACATETSWFMKVSIWTVLSAISLPPLCSSHFGTSIIIWRSKNAIQI